MIYRRYSGPAPANRILKHKGRNILLETVNHISRLLKNVRLLRFPHPSPFNVPESTPHGSGFRGPCIRTFLNSLDQRLFQQPLNEDGFKGEKQ